MLARRVGSSWLPSKREGPGCGHVPPVTAAGTEQRVARQKAADRSGTPDVKRADDSLPEAVKSLRRMAMTERRQVG